MPLKPMAEQLFAQRVLGGAAQVVDAAADAGQRAGDNHGQDDVALGVDAGIEAGIAVKAAGFELVAKGGLVAG